MIECFTESCRWWDCSRQGYMEWTHEGGKKGERLVMPNGVSVRYQRKTYVSMFESGCIASIKVVPRVYYYPSLVLLRAVFLYYRIYEKGIAVKRKVREIKNVQTIQRKSRGIIKKL